MKSLPGTLYLVCILSLVTLLGECGYAVTNEPTGNLDYQASAAGLCVDVGVEP